MYNRYIPQPDGTHRRKPIPDPAEQRPKPTCPPPAPPQPPCKEPEESICSEKPCHRKERPSPPPAMPAGNFLKQLLPRDLDTGDLIVILLLLLMAGDCREDKNTALLTLALYLFL